MNMRELGHGDVTVNKKMKNFNQVFHHLLVKFIDEKKSNQIKIDEMLKFLFLTKSITGETKVGFGNPGNTFAIDK